MNLEPLVKISKDDWAFYTAVVMLHIIVLGLLAALYIGVDAVHGNHTGLKTFLTSIMIAVLVTIPSLFLWLKVQKFKQEGTE